MIFNELTNGFEIKNDRDGVGKPVRVTLLENGLGFKLKSMSNASALGCGEEVYFSQHSYALYDYYKLTNAVTASLNCYWQATKKYEFDYKYQQQLKEWKRRKVGRIIGKFVHSQWQRLLERCDPHVVAVQKKVFADIFNQPQSLLDPDIYADAYFSQDLLKYRAASHFLYNYSVDHDYRQTRPGNFDWLAYYARDFQKYTSLNKTLTNLPAGLPTGLLGSIVNRGEHWIAPHYRERQRYDTTIPIPRPMTDRLELTFWLLSHHYSKVADIAAWATRDQIKTSVGRMAEHLRQPLPYCQTKTLSRMVAFLNDYPGEHKGNLVGLMDKAIKWHIMEREEAIERAKREGEFLAGQQTALPPISLPRADGIVFLATALDVVNEGTKMKHCVGGYASRAVNGKIYLFHIEHAGEQATAAVDVHGRVSQCLGPYNISNKASAYGQRKLSSWAKNLKGKEPLIRYVPEPLLLPTPIGLPVYEEEIYYDEIPF